MIYIALFVLWPLAIVLICKLWIAPPVRWDRMFR